MVSSQNDLQEGSPGNLAQTQLTDTNQVFAGIRGWLSLPAVGLVYSLAATLVSLFMSDSNAAVSKPLYYFSYTLSLLSIPVYLILIAKWWKRSRTLPNLMKAYYLVNIGASLMIAMYLYAVQKESIDEMKLAANTGLTVIVSWIWMMYFHISKRVKATFTE
ncbi:DUF2569 family protein [Paenibacillus validus]|uniref:DUF2569 family protein n=1 Tax=Paenibacillus validus TaxID=44253 RepID=A0A7X2Z8C7_9BACL|nr:MULTISPECIES: DUF2569 family protein [Paenibacillus]MED4602743.1 DUF2569 family protein [Paenibacillus validus]MED4604898.1 DUF2569 family protein [Paenibacillus validus]MUG70188.1 DUF2569 family protein [Paenibacillus validus]